MKEVVIEVWGDFACFTMPQAKVERLTYPFPPPSAARGILSAIYMKPKEFLWRVHRIEVLEPIRYISFKRNEIKCTVSSTPVSAEEERTQRQTTALRGQLDGGDGLAVVRRPCVKVLQALFLQGVHL